MLVSVVDKRIVGEVLVAPRVDGDNEAAEAGTSDGLPRVMFSTTVETRLAVVAILLGVGDEEGTAVITTPEDELAKEAKPDEDERDVVDSTVLRDGDDIAIQDFELPVGAGGGPVVPAPPKVAVAMVSVPLDAVEAFTAVEDLDKDGEATDEGKVPLCSQKTTKSLQQS